jgi:DNA-binding LacI/PurR family transcriptional regulator
MPISDPRRTAGPTLEDVARAAGVSRATVSRVVNGAPSVSAQVQRVVQDAIAAVGYVPNQAARQLITGRSGVIALVMSMGVSSPAEPDDGRERLDRLFSDPFFGRVASGVLGFLRTRRVYPLLMTAEGESGRKQVLDHLRQGGADGALAVSIDPADPLPRLLADAGIRAVFFARPEQPVPADYVDLAHQDGGRLAAERFLAQRRRRVAAIAGPLDLHAARARIDGFCETMARNGIAYVPVVVGNFTQDSGERAIRELLERDPDLDGVFASNDLMALGAVHVLHQLGRRVPEDVAVVGFDDSSAALASRPRLTTVRQPVEEMAARMAQLLLERLDAPELPPRAVIFDPQLVVRASG